MAMTYDPRDWYWLRADGEVYSSRRGAVVPATDAEFASWRASGRVPTLFPRDTSGAESAAELRAVLAPYGIPGPDGPPSHDEARAECARRIGLYASTATQLNLVAYVAALAAKPTKTSAETADLSAFAQGVAWIGAMRARWRQLVEDGTPTWREDAAWPACPQGAIDLAARF
jgi:hypothetical protein